MTIIWTVNDGDGNALSLEHEDVHLYYTCERGRYEAEIEIQDSNTVVWNFNGGQQKALGAYSLTLEILSGKYHSIKKDVCDAFCLVAKECEADIKETVVNGEVAIHQEEFTTNLNIARVHPIVPQIVKDENGVGYWYVDGVNTGERTKGESAYEMAQSQGYVGSAEEFAEDLANASGKASPDWSISKGQNGYIKSRTHYVYNAYPIPFERWEKSIDDSGNYIYSIFVGYDLYRGCIIRDVEYVYLEANYIFFGTEWESLSPAVSADIRLNLDVESGNTLLEIKLYRDGDGENYLKNFINDALFAAEHDFVAPIAEDFIPNTIARQESVDELREETTALWENLDHGAFPNLIAGDLAGRGESTPAEYTFRASGGKSIKDGRAYIKAIKGNSVVWNNMVDTRDSQDGILIYGVKVLSGHKYLLQREIAEGNFYLMPIVNGVEEYDMRLVPDEYAKIFTSQHTDTTDARVYGTAHMGGCVVADLTLMFGAGNEPTTIEEYNARKPIVADEYAVNEGEVIHMNVDKVKSVGDNAWDELWEQGALNNTTGQPISSDSHIRSKNYTEVIAGETYYMMGNFIVLYYNEEHEAMDWWSVAGSRELTIPSNVRYIKLYAEGTTYHNDILVSLYHSGWKAEKDDQYQPYWEDILPLNIIRKYFPQGMKSAGSAHDEIRYNKKKGKWEKVQKVASLDLGTLSWDTAASGHFYVEDELGDIGYSNLICARYETGPGQFSGMPKDKTIGNNDTAPYNGYIFVRDDSYTDAASFKAAMQGVILYYELAQPIVTEITDTFRDYYNVADFGTEQAISSTPSAPFAADIIYQFNAVDMIRENYNEIQKLKEMLNVMQVQLASLK